MSWRSLSQIWKVRLSYTGVSRDLEELEGGSEQAEASGTPCTFKSRATQVG